MKKVILAGALTLAILGSVVAAVPAGAVTYQTLYNRQVKSYLTNKFHIPNINSVKCVGATNQGAKPGSKFTCYAYNKNNFAVGVASGTNLGGGESNILWQPS